MARHPRRSAGSPGIPVRSVRIENDIWEQASKRATDEGYTMSAVMSTFVDLYAKNLLDMPTMQTVVTPPRVG